MRSNVHQGASCVRSVRYLNGVDRRVGHILFLHLVVNVGEGCCHSVESGVGNALIAVVEVLTLRTGWTILQLTELHLLAGLPGVTTRTLAPKVVPSDVTGPVVVTGIAHADVVGYHALEYFVVIESHVTELYRCGDIVCLRNNIESILLVVCSLRRG